MNKLNLIIGIIFAFQTVAYSQSCLPEGITFTNQEQIDNFQTNYPGCTEIEGDVWIGSSPLNDSITNLNGLIVLTQIGGNCFVVQNENLVNLNGLDSLTSIGGSLSIQKNSGLISLSGLENLETIGKDLFIWLNPLISNINGLESLQSIGEELHISSIDSLVNLSGLDNLTYIGETIVIKGNHSLVSISELGNISSLIDYLRIEYNYSLPSLSGLENLIFVEQVVSISDNASLTSLNGLQNLEYVGSTLEINNNDSLTSLNGLDNLESIGGLWINDNKALSSISALSNLTYLTGIHFTNNASLTSLSGLENFDGSSLSHLYIYENPMLSFCDVTSICDFFKFPSGGISIWGNAPGCKSSDEIKESCTNFIGEVITGVSIQISPNPVTSFLSIDIPFGEPVENAIIYNHLGQMVSIVKPVNNIVYVSALEAGLYLLEISVGDRIFRTKFLKD